jgi:phosphate transport system substrate-binding protein
MNLAAATVVVVASWACGSDASKTGTDTSKPAASTATTSSGAVDLTGAGATFPYPLYNKWVSEYAAKTGVKINYQSIGSGGGIRQLQEQTVDFGASDAPMSDAEMTAAKGGAVFHIPATAGVVAIAYNLPEVTQQLKLTGPVVADIFLGKITKWNDARIAALNAGVKLPATDILVVHRSDGSGTTYVFTDYLSAISPAWKAAAGKGKDVKWATGLGGKGNEGVAGQVKQTPGAIGYIEAAYVKENALTAALIQNKAGQFVAPTAAGAAAAIAGAATSLSPASDFRVSIVNAAGEQSYPISSFTWLLVYKTMPDAGKAKKLADFIRWALNEGEQYATALEFASLPAPMKSLVSARIDSIAAGGAK